MVSRAAYNMEDSANIPYRTSFWKVFCLQVWLGSVSTQSEAAGRSHSSTVLFLIDTLPRNVYATIVIQKKKVFQIG